MAKINEGSVIITLQNTESVHTYTTTRNKRNTAGRMEISKHDQVLKTDTDKEK